MALFKEIKIEKHTNSYSNYLIRNEINYILKWDKIRSRYFGGWNILIDKNINNLIAQFEMPASYFHKEGHLPLRHFILSFDGFDDYLATPEILYHIGQRLSLSVFSEINDGPYQVLFGVHEDTANRHIHFLVNTVDLITGKILSISPYDFRQLMCDVDLFYKLAQKDMNVRLSSLV